MAYDNYNKLKYKSKSDAHLKDMLRDRVSKLTSTGLPTINGDIKLALNKEVLGLLQAIEVEYFKLKIKDSYESYVIWESFSTCAIEGSRATVADTVRILDGDTVGSKSEKMVSNNIQAIEFIKDINIINTNSLEDVVIKAWRIITSGVCDNTEIQGDKYRIGNVGVVGPAQNIVFRAPEYNKVQLMMNSLFEFIRNNKFHTILASIIIHYYFVYIHPFCDGSGRTARLLLNQYLINSGYKRFNSVSITTEIYKSVGGYYKSLEYSDNDYNDITFFILYYLNAIYIVLRKINTGLGARVEDVSGMINNRQIKAVKFLKKNKGNFITQSRYSDSYNVSKNIAAKELNELVELRLLKKEMHKYMIYKWWEYDI